MSDIKWIKIYTDIFSNRKIRIIETLPDGDSIIAIWLKILCLAGDVNDGGNIYVTPEMPYKIDTLATIFYRPVELVNEAIETFERFQMIERNGDYITVKNWEKYQNVDAMERAKESNRERQARFRENRRTANVTDNVTSNVTDNVSCNVTITP